MKIRLGFVSNSSSASFIVTLHDLKTKKDLYKFMASELCAELRYEISLCETIKHYTDTIKYNEDRIKSDKKWGKLFDSSAKDYKKDLPKYKKRLEELKKYISNWNEKDHLRIKKEILDYYGIEVKEVASGVQLRGNTSMYNDGSDISEIMRNIVINYVFHGKSKKLTCNVERDG